MIYSPIETEGYRKVKANAMAYLQAMKVGSEPGIYKKEACETGPSTYGSYHATQVLSLFGELQKNVPEGSGRMGRTHQGAANRRQRFFLQQRT